MYIVHVYFSYLLCYVYIHVYCAWLHVHVPVFLISSYGAPLAQRDYCLALHSSLFGPYIVTNSINSVNWLKMHSQWRTQCHTLTFVEPIWPMLQNISKTLTCTMLELLIILYTTVYMVYCTQIDSHTGMQVLTHITLKSLHPNLDVIANVNRV